MSFVEDYYWKENKKKSYETYVEILFDVFIMLLLILTYSNTSSSSQLFRISLIIKIEKDLRFFKKFLHKQHKILYLVLFIYLFI